MTTKHMVTDAGEPAAMIEKVRQGLMADFRETSHPTLIYGMVGGELDIEHAGTSYGIMWGREVQYSVDGGPWRTIRSGQYFSIPHAERLSLRPDTFNMHETNMGFVATRLDYTGLANVGGPVEDVGRLRYIDGCSDSLLIGPPLKGDPCLNLLHFPDGIEQTMHTHPTIRAGLIHSGLGACRTATGREELREGMMFILYPEAKHAFDTVGTDGMTLTVFHPDTDTGPSHDDHPMLNRTVVDGVSAAKIDRIRTKDIRR